MKLSSILARIFLPVPVAFVAAIVIALLAAVSGIVRFENLAFLQEPLAILGIFVFVSSLQLSVGYPSLRFLRRKSLVSHTFFAFCTALLLGALGGIMGLITGPADNPGGGVRFQSLFGILIIAGPAMIIGYAATWLRFTVFPHRKHRRRSVQSQDERVPNEEIAKVAIPAVVKTSLPEPKETTEAIEHLKKKMHRRRRHPEHDQE